MPSAVALLLQTEETLSHCLTALKCNNNTQSVGGRNRSNQWYTLSQFVEALRYKPEGRGLNSRRGI